MEIFISSLNDVTLGVSKNCIAGILKSCGRRIFRVKAVLSKDWSCWIIDFTLAEEASSNRFCWHTAHPLTNRLMLLNPKGSPEASKSQRASPSTELTARIRSSAAKPHWILRSCRNYLLESPPLNLNPKALTHPTLNFTALGAKVSFGQTADAGFFALKSCTAPSGMLAMTGPGRGQTLQEESTGQSSYQFKFNFNNSIKVNTFTNISQQGLSSSGCAVGSRRHRR